MSATSKAPYRIEWTSENGSFRWHKQMFSTIEEMMDRFSGMDRELEENLISNVSLQALSPTGKTYQKPGKLKEGHPLRVALGLDK